MAKINELPEDLVMMLREIGYTDEHIEGLEPEAIKIALSAPELAQYDLIMECTESKYCTAGNKKGHKIVLNALGHLDKDRSDWPICAWALQNIQIYISMGYDRACEGLDLNQAWWRHTECGDTGWNHGGNGKTWWKIYFEKVRTPEEVQRYFEKIWGR